MFYSDLILAKRGPLARVWLAAHWERKLSKNNYLQANIEKSVTAIMGQEVVPMALRLSGQLLLGVVRIYSRKAKYLLDDCNEALLKIKVAFRSGAVDLTSDQLTVSGATITLPSVRTDFNLGLPDPMLENWDTDQFRTPSKAKKPRNPGSKGETPGSAHTARESDITLARQDFDSYDDGFDVASLHDGIQSQDFDPDGEGGLDLGLDFDDFGMIGGDNKPKKLGRRNEVGKLVDENGDEIDEEMEDSFDVGVGRDALPNTSRQSFGSLMKEGEGNQDISMDENVEFPQDDGVDFFDGGGEMPDFNVDGIDNAARMLARSETPMEDPLSDVTPRTQNQIRLAAEKREKELAAKGLKGKKMVIDSVTELAEKGATGRRGVDGILTAERYLPSSRAHLRLLSIRADPTAYLLPYSSDKSSSVYAGPSDLAPELHSLFTFDVSRRRAGGVLSDERTPKRARLDGDDEIEVGRRDGEGNISGFGNLSGLDGDLTGLADLDQDMPQLDDYPDFGGFDQGPEDLNQSKTVGEESVGRLPALERLNTPEEQIESMLNESFTPSTNDPLAGFELRASDSTEEKSNRTGSGIDLSGWSRNTIRAQKVIRSQLEKIQDRMAFDDDQEVSLSKTQVTMSFEKVAENSTRRAAAGFFFELLVLGTKDCIEIKQDDAYGEIQVKGKESLWETSGRTPSSGTARREEVAAEADADMTL